MDEFLLILIYVGGLALLALAWRAFPTLLQGLPFIKAKRAHERSGFIRLGVSPQEFRARIGTRIETIAVCAASPAGKLHIAIDGDAFTLYYGKRRPFRLRLKGRIEADGVAYIFSGFVEAGLPLSLGEDRLFMRLMELCAGEGGISGADAIHDFAPDTEVKQ